MEVSKQVATAANAVLKTKGVDIAAEGGISNTVKGTVSNAAKGALNNYLNSNGIDIDVTKPSISDIAKNAANAFLKSQGIDLDVSNPSLKGIATAVLTGYLVPLGVPAPVASFLAKKIVGKIFSGDFSLKDITPKKFRLPKLKTFFKKKIKEFLNSNGVNTNKIEAIVDDMTNKTEQVAASTPTSPVEEAMEPPQIIENESGSAQTTGTTDEKKLDNVIRSKKNEQLANEAVDIDRFTKDTVKGFLPPMNWWDKLPDWPVYSYTSIIMDQTRAAKKYILDGLPVSDEIEFEIESRKYPYKSLAVSTLKKGKVDPGTTTEIVGHEIKQLAKDKDTVKDTDPLVADIPLGIVTDTVQPNTKYFPIAPIFTFPEPHRDDLTDQKNPALDLVDTQRLVDEFLDIGKRIYDSQTENPTIFGFDDINSKYEKDKNIMLANYKQYKANVRRMEYINNIIENNSNKYLIENITYRHDVPVCSLTEEYWTRYLREKLLAWYNETDDPETKIWDKHHWLPGEPGYIVQLLTVGDYEWYDNLVAGLEDSVARLEDLEAVIDLIASMSNTLGTIAKYATAIENAEILVEDPEFNASSSFTDEIIDQTMLKELLGLAEIVGSFGGEITPIRAELEGLRHANQGILDAVRVMSPTFLAYPIIWTKLDALCAVVKEDIEGPLNTLILNRRGDNETVGWHSSPSHLELDITTQLDNIVATVEADVQNIIDKQALLPTQGLNRLDSMLNKINEIRMWGPLCAIPFHYQIAIDNVNAAERLYNDIWSDVFDCWEREYIIRNWRILVEHHMEGVIPASNYGKPLFSAECPHHLPLLLAPVPVDYRDIDINYLSANCRKNFNFLASWLTSALYAIGIKRVALGNVINDTSLNGNDENISWLAELNTLNDKNLTIKDEMDNIISQYNGTGELLPKAKLDQIIAAKELSPHHYSNHTLLNMSSELHLLDTSPITSLKVASNENRTGTTVDNSKNPEWDAHVAPAKALKDEVEAENVVETLEVNTIPTVGGPSEIIVDTGVSADDDASTMGAYVGDVPEFEPWFYMTPDWNTQRELPEIPIVVPPEPTPVIPGTQKILDPVPVTESLSTPPVTVPPRVIIEPPENNQVTKDPTSPRTNSKTILTNEKTMVSPVENLADSARFKSRNIEAFQNRLRSIIASSSDGDEETRKI